MNCPKIFSKIHMNFLSNYVGTLGQIIIYIHVIKLNITEVIIQIKQIWEAIF